MIDDKRQRSAFGFHVPIPATIQQHTYVRLFIYMIPTRARRSWAVGGDRGVEEQNAKPTQHVASSIYVHYIKKHQRFFTKIKKIPV